MKRVRDNIEPHKVCNRKELSHLRKLEYLQPYIVRLDLPFILTEDKMLVLGMPYLKLEGNHIDAVRLLDVCDKEGYVYLKIEDIKTGRVYTISWLLEYEGEFWLWSIASLEFIENDVFSKI
jgi:hypothetical protein